MSAKVKGGRRKGPTLNQDKDTFLEYVKHLENPEKMRGCSQALLDKFEYFKKCWSEELCKRFLNSK